MKIAYYPDTDSMYIDLSAKKSTESVDVLRELCWIMIQRETLSALT